MEARPSLDGDLTPSLVLQQQILTSVQDLSGKVNGFAIKLFGDATVENERGRFPLLEKTVERLEEKLDAQIQRLADRVERIERQMIRYTAMASVIGALGSALIYAIFHWLAR